MVIGIIMGFIGLIFVTVGGVLWKYKKISLLHDYHYSNVKEEDKSAFCRLSGLGIISIGVGIIVTGIIIAITDSVLSFIAFALGFSLGIFLLLYAGKKYNGKMD